MFCFRIGHATAQPSATSAKVNPMRSANQNKWRLLPTAVGRARQNGELMSSIIWMLDKRLSSAIISSKLPRCHIPAYHKMAKGITSKHNINWIGLVRIQSHRETNTSKPPASPTSRTSHWLSDDSGNTSFVHNLPAIRLEYILCQQWCRRLFQTANSCRPSHCRNCSVVH